MNLFLPTAQKLFSLPVEASVIETITVLDKGRVKYQATSWPAKLYGIQSQTHVTPGQAVAVIGREGNTLLVQPRC